METTEQETAHCSNRLQSGKVAFSSQLESVSKLKGIVGARSSVAAGLTSVPEQDFCVMKSEP
eukprot:704938-Amphidinium_carterae.1